jgi:uncharacterized protein (DUF2336 family)
LQHQQASTDATQPKADKEASPAFNSASSMALSAGDVEKLLGDSTPDARIDITNKLSANYTDSKMSPTEVVVAEQIFRLLMRDMEVRVRSCLASNIKENDTIPKDIVLTLARDVEEVSLPVLEYSQVLDDSDLIEIIQSTKEISRHMAVSKRKEVSGRVTESLLDTGNDKVAMELANNVGAYISEDGLQKIIDSFGDNEKLLETVSKRPQLPVAAVEKLMNVVSASLAEELKKKYKDIPVVEEKAAPEQAVAIDAELEKVKESETLKMLGKSWSQEEIDKLITQLIAFDRLSPSLIMRALCQGNFNFFESSLARLSNIPLSNARTLINDRGELGFRAIYNKSGLPDAMFPAVKLLNKVVRELHEEGESPASAQFANRIVERILHYSEDEPVDNMSYVIALIRRVSE